MPDSKKKRRGGEGGKGRRRSAAARPKSASPAPYILGGAFGLAGLIVLVAVMSGGPAPAPAPKQGPPAAQAPQPPPQPRPAPPARPASAPVSKPARPAARPETPRAAPQARARIEFVDAGFDGSTDLRHHVASCGNCNESLDERFATCPNCRAELTWQKDVPCPYCSKKPKVEDVETKKGFCAFCDGTRKNPNYNMEKDWMPFGRTRGEPKGCPVCVSSGTCRKCQGSGRFPLPEWFGQ